MAIYDYEGKVIQQDTTITDEQVRDAFMRALGDGTITVSSRPGDTLGVSEVLFNKAAMDTQYAALLAAYKAHPNSVPFFIHSDQHGRGMEIQRYANNIDTDGMEYASINGGDSVVDTFGTAALEAIYQRIRYIKNYIGVPGNHDYKKPTGENVSEYMIRRVFTTTNLERCPIRTSSLDCYVAYHPMHAVKFICIDPYDAAGVSSGMGHPYYNDEVTEWLIEELGKADGYDIVVIVHEPFSSGLTRSRSTNYPDPLPTPAADSLYSMVKARKQHTSGTFTNTEGNSFSYDFSNTETDVFCVLSGHWHSEAFSDVGGLTFYIQDWAGSDKYGGTFGLIDRESNLLRIFSFDNSSGAKTELDLSLQN